MSLTETTQEHPILMSAYPPDVSDLMPLARRSAILAGEIPSIRRAKQELRIGSPKAKEVIARLTAELPELPISAGAPAYDADAEVIDVSDARPEPVPATAKRPSAWPLALLALPAFVAVWSGWVGLGELTGFGVVHPLPGIADSVRLNTAITLPIGVETYAAYAIRIWLSNAVPARARRFAKWSVLGALALGAAGQIAYHLMAAWHMTQAPWPITTAVATLPLLVVFAGSGLAHLVRTDPEESK